jgi:hypothetical protein
VLELEAIFAHRPRDAFISRALRLPSKVNPPWRSTGLNTLHLLAEASCAGPVVNDDRSESLPPSQLLPLNSSRSFLLSIASTLSRLLAASLGASITASTSVQQPHLAPVT